MSLSKTSSSKSAIFSSRLKKAQASRKFSLSASFFSDELVALINAHSNAIGVTPEFILWPMLTAIASLMGTHAFIKINPEWIEPSIIWFVIAARKGEKKTAGLKRIKNPIEKLQKKLQQESVSDESTDQGQSSQLIVDHFSFEELHSIMCKNRGQVLGLFVQSARFVQTLF